MWKCKMVIRASQVVEFLNENNIKPENCKTEHDDCYSIFYYVVGER